MCKCKKCGKKFKYGDKNSPMLKNDIWNKIVSYYNLQDYESKAFERYKSKKFGFCRGFIDKDEYHLYLCTDCMEKALGRKLLKSDLIGENVPLNEDFEKSYFCA